MSEPAQKLRASDAIDVDEVLAAMRRVLGPRATAVALHEPEFHASDRAYVMDCLESGWVSSVGKYVDRFESLLCDYTHSPHAIATMNGTAALHICLLVSGVERGDEVLLPTLTFVATANAVSYVGAIPHFIDSEARTLGADARKLSEYLHDIAEVRDGVCVNRFTGARIRALVPMHTFGHPVDIGAALAVCARWDIALIEDAAESLGSFYGTDHTGTRARVAAVSFNGNKIATTGGGGAILTRDPHIATRAKHLTTTARVAHRWSFLHDEVGYNYRLPNLNAALGCAQLERLPDAISRKRRLAQRYIDAFADIPGVSIMREPAGCRSNYWLNALLLNLPDIEVRDALLASLVGSGFMARPVWTLMHRLPMFAACPRMDLSQAEALESRIINLPSSAFLAST